MKSAVRVVLCVALTSGIGACSQPSEPMGEAGQAAAQQPAAPASTAPAVDMVSKQIVADQLPSIPGVGEIRGDSLVSTGKEGFLIFGPYVAVEAGTYTLAIKGNVSEVPAGSISWTWSPTSARPAMANAPCHSRANFRHSRSPCLPR